MESCIIILKLWVKGDCTMIKIQKRKEIRANVDIQMSVKKILLNKTEIISPDKTFPARIKNLSTSGALLKSPLSVPVNLKFIFELIDEKSKILCYLEIERKQKCGEAFIYGCKLRPVFENDKDKLRVFVLKKQVQNLKGINNDEDEKIEISNR